MTAGTTDRAPLAARLLATGFGAGYLPGIPGTAGTALGMALAFVPGLTDAYAHASFILAILLAGAWAADRVATVEGHRLTAAAAKAKALFQPGGHAAPDPSIVVIDEVLGMLVALFLVPQSWAAWGCAFVLFRVFDILKPPPARQLEAVPHGWGIMLDDLMAGIYANILTQLLVRLIFPTVGW